MKKPSLEEEPKEETFVISKEQIDVLCGKNEVIHEMMREWFPSAFAEDKKELVVGKWYNYNKSILCYVKKENNLLYGYGFNRFGDWINGKMGNSPEEWEEATPEEVKEALTKEAVKRGFKEGEWISWKNEGIGQINGKMYWAANCLAIPCDSKTTKRNNNNFPLFHEGIWAEIIPTITKKEAEKLLNKKII